MPCPVQDRSALSIIAITSSSLKRCISFKDDVVVSGALALSMWICLTLRYSVAPGMSSEAYHGRVELVQTLPLLLAWCHDVDLLVC